VAYTLKPVLANKMETAKPIPLEVPVTIATYDEAIFIYFKKKLFIKSFI
jgi:hypothetical protein